MSKIDFTTPYLVGSANRYASYRSWLENNLHPNVCAYCLMPSASSLPIEHYSPKSYEPQKINDPENLLLGCADCNGPGCKWDYHPHYLKRTCRSNDTSGHLIHNIRYEDLGLLFAWDHRNSRLVARKGRHTNRAIWLMTVFDFKNREIEALVRKVIQLLAATESLLEIRGRSKNDRTARSVIPALIDQLTPFLVMLEALGFRVSVSLHRRLMSQTRPALQRIPKLRIKR